MMWGYGGFGVGMWLSMLLFWLVPILLVVGLFYFLPNKNRQFPGNRSEDPEQVLKTRYAKGEISEEEFRRMREELKK